VSCHLICLAFNSVNFCLFLPLSYALPAVLSRADALRASARMALWHPGLSVPELTVNNTTIKILFVLPVFINISELKPLKN
jgi:hypothetical protein